MKLKLSLLGATLLGFSFFPFPLAQAADSGGKHSAGLMVGQVWPAGEIGKDVDASVAPGVFYEYSSSDVFSLYSSLVRSSHSDGNLSLTSANVGMKANLFYFDRLSPYALIGAGLYFVGKRFGAEEANKLNFGLHVGVGAELDISDKVFLALEFDLHNLFTSKVSLAQGRKDVSGRWTGFFLKGGMRF